MEGKETGNGNAFTAANGQGGGQTGSVDECEAGWESDDEEEWEDVGRSRPGSSDSSDDVDSEEDLLKGINTEVYSPVPKVSYFFCTSMLMPDVYC